MRKSRHYPGTHPPTASSAESIAAFIVIATLTTALAAGLPYFLAAVGLFGGIGYALRRT